LPFGWALPFPERFISSRGLPLLLHLPRQGKFFFGEASVAPILVAAFASRLVPRFIPGRFGRGLCLPILTVLVGELLTRGCWPPPWRFLPPPFSSTVFSQPQPKEVLYSPPSTTRAGPEVSPNFPVRTLSHPGCSLENPSGVCPFPLSLWSDFRHP